jgi:hypothetical protein
VEPHLLWVGLRRKRKKKKKRKKGQANIFQNAAEQPKNSKEKKFFWEKGTLGALDDPEQTH